LQKELEELKNSDTLDKQQHLQTIEYECYEAVAISAQAAMHYENGLLLAEEKLSKVLTSSAPHIYTHTHIMSVGKGRRELR
jgi:hypothetical protein